LLVGALLLGILFAACEKPDPNAETNDLLQGDWEVESWTLDGVEQMGSNVNTFDIEFKAETDTGGETEWSFIDVLGQAGKIEAEYNVENEGKEIDVEGDDLTVTFSGNVLKLSGNIDGNRWEIEAEKD
ncbi:MAG: hypothetical protein AAF806_25480, partial [Bacteroidota bacterium]